jgi:hypothetical protein
LVEKTFVTILNFSQALGFQKGKDQRENFGVLEMHPKKIK